MHYFLTDTAFASIKTDQKKRTFTGIANSGKPFVYQGVRAIADLSDISFADKVPVLLLHDRDKRVGVGVLAVIDNQLVITGDLLDNEQGQTLATESDAGFPFQMSAHIIADYEEKLTHGQTAVVNGQTVTGEITILRKCRVSEVSFTPTGVDKKTIAMILSNQFSPNHSNPNHFNQGHAMTDQTSKTDPKTDDEITKLKQQIAALLAENKKLKSDKHKIAVEAKLSDKGFKKDDQGKFLGIDSATIDVLLSLDETQATTMIAAITPPKSVPEFLLSEQYGTNNVKSNDPINPLLEDAKARATK